MARVDRIVGRGVAIKERSRIGEIEAGKMIRTGTVIEIATAV